MLGLACAALPGGFGAAVEVVAAVTSAGRAEIAPRATAAAAAALAGEDEGGERPVFAVNKTPATRRKCAGGMLTARASAVQCLQRAAAGGAVAPGRGLQLMRTVSRVEEEARKRREGGRAVIEPEGAFPAAAPRIVARDVATSTLPKQSALAGEAMWRSLTGPSVRSGMKERGQMKSLARCSCCLPHRVSARDGG